MRYNQMSCGIGTGGNLAHKHTLGELRAHLLYKGLTDKQKTFLEAYIETGDKMESARRAYGDVKSLENMAWRALNTPNIRKLLTYYHGQEAGGGAMSRSELLMLISERLRDKDTSGGDFRKLAELLVAMKFKGGAGPAEAEAEPETIDDLVKKLEGKE